MGYIDSKCHMSKLKSSRTCLIGYSGFISSEWFFIAWGWTHKHTYIQTSAPKKPGMSLVQQGGNVHEISPILYISCTSPTYRKCTSFPCTGQVHKMLYVLFQEISRKLRPILYLKISIGVSLLCF